MEPPTISTQTTLNGSLVAPFAVSCSPIANHRQLLSYLLSSSLIEILVVSLYMKSLGEKIFPY